MSDLIEQLSEAQVFRRIPAKELEQLAELASLKKLSSNEFLCHQGDHWPYVVFISRGVLRWAILSVSGREQVLYLLESAAVFWGHSLFDDQPMPASLMAKKPSRVYLWSRETIQPFLYRFPEAMWEIVQYQAQIMRKAREVIYGLAFKPVAGRLAKLLLDTTGLENSAEIRRELTLNEIAAMVNSTQEVVCRVLYQFQTDGILQINRASIQIQDFEALNELKEIE